MPRPKRKLMFLSTNPKNGKMSIITLTAQGLFNKVRKFYFSFALFCPAMDLHYLGDKS